MKKEQRRKERELALYGLFRYDFHNENEPTVDIIENFTDEELIEELKKTTGDYADKIVKSFEENQDKIDDVINKYMSKNWTLNKIAKTEKAILRLAVTEMLFLDNPVPKEIAINEAIELSKAYGSEDSRKYINGLLSNLANNEISE